jgi:hypothetical protein
MRAPAPALGRLAALALLLAVAAPASGGPDECPCRDLSVRCTTTPQSVVIGDTFEMCAVVTGVGSETLENVRLTFGSCPGAHPVPSDAPMSVVIPKLAQGQTFRHCIKFACQQVGACRLSAHAVDASGVAAAGCLCTTFCRGLPALQVEMIDTAADRSPKGIFKLGEEVMYRLSVENDVGSALTPDLTVSWALPPELTFLHGQADAGITISGSGQAATSSRFVLRPNQHVIMEIVCRVTKVPPRSLVQTRATVLAYPSGQELAEETESTTLKR